MGLQAQPDLEDVVSEYLQDKVKDMIHDASKDFPHLDENDALAKPLIRLQVDPSGG